jgi:hypothetical protein
MGLVLDEDGDLSQAGVDAVAQRNVDDPVLAAEGNRRFCALFGQRVKPLALASGEDHGKHVVHWGKF